MNDEHSETIRPFHSGSHFGDWCASNCSTCTKAPPEADYDSMPCEIEKALSLAYMTDGRIPLLIADRMGHGEGRYGWPCLAHDPPFRNVRDGKVDQSVKRGEGSAA